MRTEKRQSTVLEQKNSYGLATTSSRSISKQCWFLISNTEVHFSSLELKRALTDTCIYILRAAETIRKTGFRKKRTIYKMRVMASSLFDSYRGKARSKLNPILCPSL